MQNRQKPFIVVGIDGSDESLAALRWALREGVSTSARVDVIHAWHAKTARDAAFGSAHELARGSVCMLQNEVAAALTEMPAAPEVTQTSVHGRPAFVLLDRADGAQQLVLGEHSHTDLRDIVFGQLAAACRRQASCPVIVVDRDAGVVTWDSHKSAAARL